MKSLIESLLGDSEELLNNINNTVEKIVADEYSAYNLLMVIHNGQYKQYPDAILTRFLNLRS